MSSIASHIHATNAIALLTQQQVPGSAQDTGDTGSDPFAALLDAAAAPTDPQPTGTAVANGAARTSNTGASTAANATTPTTTATSATKTTESVTTITNATALAQPQTAKTKTNAVATATASKLNELLASANLAGAAGQTAAAAGAAGSPITTAQTAKAALAKVTAQTITLAGDANSPARQVTPAQQQPKSATGSAQQQTTAATPADTDDESSETPSADAAIIAQDAILAPASTASAQPIAAAITIANQTNSAPISGTSSPDATIGDATKARAKLVLASAANTTVAAQASGDSSPAKPAPAAGKTESSAAKQAAANKDAPSVQAASSDDPQRAPVQTDDNTPAALPTSASVTAAAQPVPHADIIAATTSNAADTANAQTASTGVKADGTGLPNFGISAANGPAPASTNTVAQAATNAAAPVPIAGLAVAIANRAQAGSNQFDIRLDPPELGRIDVQLNVDSNGQITSHITVDRADTLQLLQSQQPQIQQALDQSGLQTADNGLQFSLRDQSFAGQNNNGGGAQQQSMAQIVIPDADLPTVQSTQAYTRLNLRGGLDIRV